MSPGPAATANPARVVLRAESLRKRFGSRVILAGVTLELLPGEVALLTGANGSGKTTLVRILATLLAPDAGRVTLDGTPVDRKPAEARRLIGFASHVPLLYPGLSPVENLRFFGRLSGVADAERRARALLERLGLAAFSDVPMMHFSRGMLQRVALSRALLPEPRVLILDEPYAGLDDDGVRAVNELVAEARSRDAATLLVAHDHERAAPVVTRRMRIREGRCEAA